MHPKLNICGVWGCRNGTTTSLSKQAHSTSGTVRLQRIAVTYQPEIRTRYDSIQSIQAWETTALVHENAYIRHQPIVETCLGSSPYGVVCIAIRSTHAVNELRCR